MYRRDCHGVRGRIADVRVRVRVITGGLVLEPLGEALVLRLRFGGEVDLLVVRDDLAELAELVEHEFTPAGLARQRVLTHFERFEEIEIKTLDVIDRVPPVRGEVPTGLQHLQGPRPVGAGRDQRGAVPESLQRAGVDLADHESKDPDDRLDLRAVEQPV